MRARHSCKLLCAVVLFCGAALAQPAPSARDHFARGLELAQHGELDAAAAEFEEAYRQSPNYAVLYNLGQAYVALGKPVEAVRAFEQYLEGGAARVSAARRQEVEELILLNKKRIGYVSLSIEPPGSEILVDGRPVGKSPLRERLSLVVGTHGVTVQAPGRSPFAGGVDVSSGKEAALTISLKSDTTDLPTKVGMLAVGCDVPGATISLDSVPLTSLEPVVVPVGAHDVVCERAGYVPSKNPLDIVEGALTRLACVLEPRQHLLASETGILSFLIDQPGAHVSIDGRASAANVTLPAGPHRARVHRSGFEDWTETETARPGFPMSIDVRLHPTPEHAQEIQDATRSRRTWAYVLGGAGLALVGTGAAVYASDGPRYTAWRQDHDALSRDIQNQQWSPMLSERAAELQSRSASIRGRDDLALGTALVGGALLSYAVVSWLSPDW